MKERRLLWTLDLRVVLIQIFAKVVNFLKLIRVFQNNHYNERTDELLFEILLLKFISVFNVRIKSSLSKQYAFNSRNFMFYLVDFFLFLFHNVVFHQSHHFRVFFKLEIQDRRNILNPEITMAHALVAKDDLMDHLNFQVFSFYFCNLKDQSLRLLI